MSNREWTLLLLVGLLVSSRVPGHSHAGDDKLLVPAYGPGYSALEDMTKRHLAVSERIDGRLARMEAKIVGGVLPPGAQDGLALLRSRCARCHTAPADKGGQFALFNDKGEMAALKPLERKAMTAAVEYQGDTRMPPAAKLPDDEVSAIKSYLLTKEK